MKRKKSTIEDERIVVDEAAYSPDRLSSMRKLASDGFGKQLHPILNDWLNNSEFILRDGAISMLLGSWGLQKYVDKAVELLHKDGDWSVRMSAARALADFCQDFIEGEMCKDNITKELLISLLNDDDEFVQRDSYKSICRIIKNESWSYYNEKDSFDRDQDVDWNLLQPYLKKYDLKPPE